MISDAAKGFHDLLRAVPTGGARPPIEEVRAASEAWGMLTGDPEGVSFEPVDASGVPAEWALPSDADASRVLLYLHGGGYTIGSIGSHRRLVGHLAKAAGVRGLSVGYRLAPEHPFPAALDDAVTAYSWLLERGHEPHHIGIGGDSAGGGLALATALALAERGLPAPAGLVLLSPWTDLAGTGDSITTNRDKDLILRGMDTEEPAGVGYTTKDNLKNPLVSPLYADYRGFAPFIVHVGGDELLLDDSTRLAERASGRLRGDHRGVARDAARVPDRRRQRPRVRLLGVEAGRVARRPDGRLTTRRAHDRIGSLLGGLRAPRYAGPVMGDYLSDIVAAHRAAAATDERDVDELIATAVRMTPTRGFTRAITAQAGDGLAVIAEIKRRSPSKGDLDPGLDPARWPGTTRPAGRRASRCSPTGRYFGGSPRTCGGPRRLRRCRCCGRTSPSAGPTSATPRRWARTRCC